LILNLDVPQSVKLPLIIFDFLGSCIGIVSIFRWVK
jgi:hypothetical protein